MGCGGGAEDCHSGAGSSGHQVSETGQAAHRMPTLRGMVRTSASRRPVSPAQRRQDSPPQPPGPGRAGEGNVIPTQLTRLWRPAPGRVAAGAGLRLRGPQARGPIPGKDAEFTRSQLLGPRPEVTRSLSGFGLSPPPFSDTLQAVSWAWVG